MKRFVPVLLVLFLFTACEKEPNTDDLDDNFLVYTDYDKTEDFGSFTKFYIPDSILLISDSKEAQYWKDDNALRIIKACVNNMEERGYLRVDKKDQADLGIQMSYVEDTHYFTGYSDPYWWWDYPGYWYPGYWGGNWGGGWYYPYPITYSYSTGSLLADMINLKNAPEGQKEKLTVVWNAYISGLLGGSGSLNVNRTTTAINQAFTQSPYLKK